MNIVKLKVRTGMFSIAEFADFLGISEDLLWRELPQSGVPYIKAENGEIRIPYDCVEQMLFADYGIEQYGIHREDV